MKTIINPFYLICNSYFEAQPLVPLGIKTLQLRIKDTSLNDIREQIRLARNLCLTYQCQLIINDYWQLALEEKCDFIHLGQEDLEEADIAAIKKANIKLGLSTHSLEELEKALSYQPDYVALGPIFPTILKKMAWAPQGLEKLAQWKALINKNKNHNIPLVAIGGFNIERGLKALEMGADSVAVVTDVSLHINPSQRVKEWLEAIKKWQTTFPISEKNNLQF